jgi:hypothetical protein
VIADDLAILRICSGSNQPKQNDKKYSHVRPHLEIRALLLMIVLAARCVSGSQDCEAPAAGLSSARRPCSIARISLSNCCIDGLTSNQPFDRS